MKKRIRNLWHGLRFIKTIYILGVCYGIKLSDEKECDLYLSTINHALNHYSASEVALAVSQTIKIMNS